MKKGFFGLVVLLACFSITSSLYGAGISNFQKSSQIQTSLMEMQDATFLRTEAELYLDSAISFAMAKSITPPIEATRTQSEINFAIQNGLKYLGRQIRICENGSEEPFSIGKLNKLSKVSAIKVASSTIIRHEMTKSICSKIENGNYSLFFEIPKSHSTTMWVNWQ